MELHKGWLELYLEGRSSRTVKGKTVLFLLILTNFVYVYMLLVSIPKVMGFSGSMKIPDIMPIGYEPEYVLALFEKLGVAGRSAYLYHQLPVDLLYPFLFGITYFLVILYLLQKLQKLNSETYYLGLLPFMAGLFDYLENFVLIYMLGAYPAITVSTIKLCAFFTVFKSMLSFISFLIIIVLVLKLIHQKLLASK